MSKSMDDQVESDSNISTEVYTREYLLSICYDVLYLCLEKEEYSTNEDKPWILDDSKLDQRGKTSFDTMSVDGDILLYTNLSSKDVKIVMGVLKVLKDGYFFFCHVDIDRDEISGCIKKYLASEELDMNEFTLVEEEFLDSLIKDSVVYTDQVRIGVTKVITPILIDDYCYPYIQDILNQRR